VSVATQSTPYREKGKRENGRKGGGGGGGKEKGGGGGGGKEGGGGGAPQGPGGARGGDPPPPPTPDPSGSAAVAGKEPAGQNEVSSPPRPQPARTSSARRNAGDRRLQATVTVLESGDPTERLLAFNDVADLVRDDSKAAEDLAGRARMGGATVAAPRRRGQPAQRRSLVVRVVFRLCHSPLAT